MTDRDPRLVPVPAVANAEPGDAAEVADLVANAFTSLAAVAWLVPDAADRREVLRGHFRILVEHAFRHGEVHLTADRAATAVWFVRTADLPAPPDYDARLAAACGDHTDRFRVLDDLFETHHPTQPHHHLAFLAVRPDRQGAGYGTALMRHHHRRLDHAGTSAYLEASNVRNRRLYACHGYQQSGQFSLPDGTPFYPMWRPPAGGTAAGGPAPSGPGDGSPDASPRETRR